MESSDISISTSSKIPSNYMTTLQFSENSDDIRSHSLLTPVIDNAHNNKSTITNDLFSLPSDSASTYIDESTNSPYHNTNRNYYNKKKEQQQTINTAVVNSLVSISPTIRSFEESLHRCQASQSIGSKQSFNDRTVHSSNPTINTAFIDRQKSFIRKNRAIDWILNKPLPNVDQVKAALYEKLRIRQENQVIDSQEPPTYHPNEHWGDELTKEKQRGVTRLFFQNIRGLQLTRHSNVDKWVQVLEYSKDYQINVLGLAETCTNTSINRTRHLLQRTSNRKFIQTNLCWSNSDFITETNYRPGGTLLATFDAWVGRILYPLHDPHQMGRWTGNAYQLGVSKKLFLFSAYRVCKQSPNQGLISSHRQQMLKLQQRMPFEHNLCPRQYFIKDFVNYVQTLNITAEDYIIVLMDANEQIGEEIQGIITMLQKLGLVDTFTKYHSRPCTIPTHHSSNHKRIDFIFSTSNLLPHIASCGYTSFYHGVDTDHRGLFLDLKPSFIDGQARIEAPPSRLIGRTTCKKEVAAYKEYLLGKFKEADIPKRAEELYWKARDHEFTDKDLQHLQLLDEEVTEYMLQAEKETCTAKPQFPWSPQLAQASLLIQYWTLRIRNKHSKYDISSKLECIYDKLSENHQRYIDTTTATLKYNLHKAKIRKQLLQLKAVAKRKDARILRIEQEADYRKTDTDHEQSRLAMIDETHHLFRYLEKVYGKKRSIGVTNIEVPFKDKDGELTDDPHRAVTWIKVHNPEEIVQRLMARNIKHFGQAQGTAFTISPVTDSFGYQGMTPEADDLIYKQTIPQSILNSNTSEGVKHLLAKLADGKQLKEIDDNVSFESFWKGFQVWDEMTSTSPSGRHLGHYKALLMADGQDHLYKKDEEGHSLKDDPSPTIKKVYFHIALATTLSGNTLPRWCNSSTMMIEKIPGQPRINKLRVIHLFEADYNLMLKLLWSRRLVWHAHKRQSLNEAQAGSRPDHRCIDVVLRKTMNYTYAALTRTPLITIDNDAKACYDRIPCNLAMLVSRYHGMTKEACMFQSKTLQGMKFKIRTAAGESKEWYTHSDTTPIHGTGQGSCASPCLWLLLSSTMMDCHNNLAQGMTQHDVLPTSPVRTITVEGFVDDVSIFVNPDYSDQHILLSHLEIGQRLINSGKQDLEKWNMLLDASSGKLELDKCFWYFLIWYFNKLGDPMPLSAAQIDEIFSESIVVEDKETGLPVQLVQKDVAEAHRTLGAYKSVTGNEDKQFEVLMEKSNNLAIATSTGQLSRFQARRAYTSIYIPSMTYSLVSTNLSHMELRAIQSKAIQAFLPAMGYERTFPHAVVFAPRWLGGLNVGDLYTECGVAKTIAVLEHIRANTGLGRIMQINLNWLQLQSGLGTPILESDANIASYVPINWFLHLREFLAKANSKVQIASQWVPRVEREKDCVLMDKIVQLNLPKRIIRICNNWRLYFKVLTLSDITSADGKSITDQYWKVSEAVKQDKYANMRRSKLNWPVQVCPEPSTFSAWKKCLNMALNLRGRQQLPMPLGDWIVEPRQSSNDWEYYLQPYTSKLYRNVFDGTYEEFLLDQHPSSRMSSILKFEPVPDDEVPDLPPQSFPVSPVLEYNTLRIKQSQCTCLWATSRTHNKPKDFEEHLETLPEWKKQLLLHWESVSTHQLLTFLHNTDQLLIATDGGFDLEQGTGSFGAVIADPQTIIATVMGAAPGKPDLHCSFRSEMYGLLAACALLNEITNFHRVQNVQGRCTLLFYLDSQSTIDRVRNHRYNPITLKSMTAADMDVELQILQELRELQDKGYKIPPFTHVKAHQDLHKPYHCLSREAQLNVEADKLATEFAKSDYIRQSYHPPPAVKASLFIQDIAITSKYKESLRDSIHAPGLFEYVQKKWEWSESTVDNIWWTAHGAALKRLSHADGQKIQKFNYNHLPNNRRLSKFHSHITSTCPGCNTCEESDDHIVWCNQGERLEAKQLWEQDVHHFLSEEHTPPQVRTAIMVGFHHWIYNKPIPSILQYIPTASQELQVAYNAQTKIGWNHFLRGRLSESWRILIRQHLGSRPMDNPDNESQSRKKKKKQVDKVRTSIEWASRLIISMWHGVLILWDLRNRSIHGPKGPNQSSAEKQRLLLEARLLREEYQNFQEQYEIEWFKKPMEELEQYSVISIKAWIRNARMMVRLHRLEIRKTKIIVNTEEEVLLDANLVASTGQNGGNLEWSIVE